MGMATPIGLGIALTSNKEVVVIDGDGSLLMNPGTLATAASLAPKNLTILCIDNGAYGSTGNQPTLAGSCVDLVQVARGFGFTSTVRTVQKEELVNAVKQAKQGLTFIHAMAVPGNREVPNISLHHLEIKRLIQEVLQRISLFYRNPRGIAVHLFNVTCQDAPSTILPHQADNEAERAYNLPVFWYSCTYTLIALRMIQSRVTLLSEAIWRRASMTSLSIAGIPAAGCCAGVASAFSSAWSNGESGFRF